MYSCTCAHIYIYVVKMNQIKSDERKARSEGGTAAATERGLMRVVPVAGAQSCVSSRVLLIVLYVAATHSRYTCHSRLLCVCRMSQCLRHTATQLLLLLLLLEY